MAKKKNLSGLCYKKDISSEECAKKRKKFRTIALYSFVSGLLIFLLFDFLSLNDFGIIGGILMLLAFEAFLMSFSYSKVREEQLRQKEVEELRRKMAEERRKVEEIEEKERRKQYEDKIRRENAERAQRTAEAKARFRKTLDDIPCAQIEISEAPAKKQNLSYLSEITYSNITKRTPRDKLGNFVAIDVETTGLSAQKDEIIEIAAIRFVNFKPVEKFVTLTSPKNKISAKATEINHITNEMVKGKPHFSSIAKSLQNFLGKDALVGHNLEFDLKFIVKYGVDLSVCKRKYYDTLSISQRTLKKPKTKWERELESYEINYDSDYDVENYKLGTLCDYFSIPYDSAHRALADCFATALLFMELEKERR